MYSSDKTYPNISATENKTFLRSRLVVYRMKTEIVQALSSQQRKTFHSAFQFFETINASTDHQILFSFVFS